MLQNENFTQLGTDRQTNRLSDGLLELLEWLFATRGFPTLLKLGIDSAPLIWAHERDHRLYLHEE